ncbi:MAG: hypothetical protein C5B45_02655 [Chlamydiae bacterium]|nr:MAG: hypothetical protein C5B45_02655 [Chlamydiota bacterium]
MKEHSCPSFFQDNDETQARILLEEGLTELGITRKVFDSVTLYYSNYPDERSTLVQVIQQQWLKTLRILIKLECLDFKILLDKLFNKDYFLSFLCRQAIHPDPMSILEKYKYKEHAMNFSNWEHPKFIQFSIPVWWGDRILLPMSSKACKVQKKIKTLSSN